MKLDLRFFKRILFIFPVIFFSAPLSAQIWTNYECVFRIEQFAPLMQPIVIDPQSFTNFTGVADPDDGIGSDIPVGFIFDYNGNMYSTVNACANGWASFGGQKPNPTITSNNSFLFQPNRPNNVAAPLWGDHYYRTLTDVTKGFRQSRIQYTTFAKPDTNSTGFPGSFVHTFILEWKNLNVNNKSDTNSVATFQMWIVENPLVNDMVHPNRRATIEFHYDTLSASAIGCTVGINDSLGLSHMNGLFAAFFVNFDSTRLSTDSTMNCWPPATCLTNGVIVFRPHSSKAGVSSANESSTILSKNYPNPFSKSTTISFTIPERTFATLKIFDGLGNQIAVLANKIFEPGKYDIPFDGSEVPDGIYFSRLEAGGFSETRGMVLMK